MIKPKHIFSIPEVPQTDQTEDSHLENRQPISANVAIEPNNQKRPLPPPEIIEVTLQHTCLVGVDADVDQGARSQPQTRDPVHGLHVEGVVRVHGEVQDGHRCGGQAERPGDEAQVRLAGLALRDPAVPGHSVAALAQHVVGDVLPAARVAGGHPLQEEGRVVDQRDQVPGGGGRPCGGRVGRSSFSYGSV